MTTKIAQEFQDAINSYIGKLFLEGLRNDRQILEAAALEAACACEIYDLADTLQETPDGDLLAFVERIRPCKQCGQ